MGLAQGFESFFTDAKEKIGMILFDLLPPAEKKRLQEANSVYSLYAGRGYSPLKVKSGQPDDNLFINYLELIVEKGVEFLFGRELKLTAEGETGEQHAAKLAELWPESDRQDHLVECSTDGAVFGTAYLKIKLDNNKPRVLVPDPQNMAIVTDAHDITIVKKYSNTYQVAEGNNKRYFREEVVNIARSIWHINMFESKTGGKWIPIGDTIRWPYPFAPYFHCQNLPKPKSQYGRADLSPSIVDLSKYLSRVDSLIGKIVRVHASPKPVAKNMKKQDLEIGTDETLFLGTATGMERDLKLLEMTNDLQGALAYRKMLREALSDLSKIPEIATGKVEDIGNLSGLALQILYGPLLAKTTLKRRKYGRMIEDVANALLVLDGAKDPGFKIEWPSMLPTSQKEETETALLQSQVGVSRTTILKRLGFDPEAEAENLAAEGEKDIQAGLDAFNAGKVPRS